MAKDPRATRTTKPKPKPEPKVAAADADPPVASQRKMLMENEILEHATKLFAERGFAGTSLQDIASSMGLKRSAIYYYFKSKEDLLDRLIVESTSGPARALAKIGGQSHPSEAARLHAMARHVVEWVLTHTDRFLLLVKSESDLSPASAKKFDDGRRAAIEVVTSVIERGIASGEFRTVDPQIAAFGVWGTCIWSAWWYQPSGRVSLSSVAGHLADLAVASLQRAEDRGNSALSPAMAITALRDDLDRLEQALTVQRT